MISRFHSIALLWTIILIFASVTICYGRGVLDPSFGTGGKVVTDLGSESSVRRLYQQDDGKIIVLANNSVSVLLLRYDADGTLDNTFGVGGKIVTGYYSSDTTISFNIQADGLFAVGNNYNILFGNIEKLKCFTGSAI